MAWPVEKSAAYEKLALKNQPFLIEKAVLPLGAFEMWKGTGLGW
jgi:hypothetical protein